MRYFLGAGVHSAEGGGGGGGKYGCNVFLFSFVDHALLRPHVALFFLGVMSSTSPMFKSPPLGSASFGFGTGSVSPSCCCCFSAK